MRVKQTARKSTATLSAPPPSSSNSAGRRQSSTAGSGSASTSTTTMSAPTIPLPKRASRSLVMNDTVHIKLNTLLETKRKSSTPQLKTNNGQPMYGQGGGKKILNHMVKTKPRQKPGEFALKEIRRLQSGCDNLIPRSAFHRIVRELTQDIVASNNLYDDNDGTQALRYQTAALEALQAATESYLVQVFEDSYLCCLHAKRVTLFIQDMHLCQRLQERRSLRIS